VKPIGVLLFASVFSLVVAAHCVAQVPSWPSERPPRPLAAKDVKFPPYHVRTLANGLQVIAVPHHEQPAVSLRLIVRAGAAQDPDDRPGLASLAGTLLDQGTTTKSAEQVAQAIDSIGGALGVGAGSDLTSIFAAVMKNSLDVGLDLISDVARNPAFDAGEIERQRQQMVSAMRVSAEDPDYIAGTLFERLVYGFHPYGKPDGGTPSSIAAITREDLQAFHKRWFGANNAILAIVGDVTPEQAFAGAERAFGKWGKVDVAATKLADPPAATRRVIVVDRPGAVQTEIRVGHIGLPRKHKDFLALDLALKILGGEGGNRLHRVLRSERGLTYGAEATFSALKESGAIAANTDTRSDTTAEALRLIVDEFARIRRERVSPRELADAQAYLTGSFPLTIETPGAIALQVLNAVVYGLDLEELQTYRERVNSITPDDIQRVAQQYLYPDRLSIVLVGDANVFAKQLPAVGFDQVERIPLADLDLAAPDLRRRRTGAPIRGGYTPAAYRTGQVPAAGTEPGADARHLIDKAITAKGGLALLRSIRTVRSAFDMVFATPGGEAKVTGTAYVRYPGQFRVDAVGPDGLRIQSFDNGTAWMGDGKSVDEVPATIVATMQANVQRDTIALLLALADDKVAARRGEDVTVGNTRLPSLELDLKAAGRVTLAFDPVTNLLVYQRYGGNGEPVTEERFSDYRTLAGLKVAHRISMRREGQFPIERTVKTFEVNVPLESAFFRKPPPKQPSISTKH
jgi:predicted Zn-dependent peptidase